MTTSTYSALPQSSSRVVHLEDARMVVRERGELVTEGATALNLLDSVWVSYVHHDIDGFVLLNAIAATALGVAVILGAIRMRRNRDSSSAGTNIVGVFGGLVGMVEGLHKLHSAQFTPGHKHFALGVCLIFTSLVTITMAFMMERLEHRRSLRMTDEGVAMRLNKFRRFSVTWAELAELRVGDRDAQLIGKTGRTHVVPLGRLVNRNEVRDALLDAARERGLEVTVQGAG